jgi:OFA family oxalate/formate antiporter-like MFS transporter
MMASWTPGGRPDLRSCAAVLEPVVAEAPGPARTVYRAEVYRAEKERGWRETLIADRRWQLAAGIIGMIAISCPQYAWTLFSVPLADGLHARLSDVQIAFTLFILTQSWFVPLFGYGVDRMGPRVVVTLGGVLVGASWLGSGAASSLWQLHAAYAIGGLGAGAVYSGCIGIALKWFPDRRGLASGLLIGAYGSGAALFIIPIRGTIEQQGYRAAFLGWGVVLALLLVLAAWPMQRRRANRPSGTSHHPTEAGGWTPAQVIRSPRFHLLYVLSVLVSFGGLLVTAQLTPIAIAYGLDRAAVGAGLDALSAALMVNLIVAALARPFWGWLSDRIGREETMMLSFALGGFAIMALRHWMESPIAFLVFSSLVMFAWGAAFVLFTATIGDRFGSAYAASNCGMHYTSKGCAAILAGWGAARILESAGSWLPVLGIAALCNLVAALLAGVCAYTRTRAAQLQAHRTPQERLRRVLTP